MKLEKCPFCNGEAEFKRIGTSHHSCIVFCTECGATLESNETFSSGEQWNRRGKTMKLCKDCTFFNNINASCNNPMAWRIIQKDGTFVEWQIQCTEMRQENRPCRLEARLFEAREDVK